MELGAYSVYAWAVFLYLGLLALICIMRAFYTRGDKDFMLGGRTVTSSVLVFSLIATWIGSGSLLGGAGLAYRQGYSELWLSVGAWIAILFCLKIAPKVRHLSGITLPDILERRYNSF
ncbi:MAG: sodium:solute symporter, partial [Deltaproteobacteria bacterium CG_4_10_14_0_2_um_filter_43_8]